MTRARATGLAAVLLFALFASTAEAADIGNPDDLASVEVHGFASQGFILTTGNDYIDSGTTKGSFQYSEVGVNVTKQLGDKLRVGLQLFAQDLGPKGTYSPQIDWAYVDYRWQDWLGFRAGRLKIPYGLYNEIQDVDAARVPVLLPQSVYPLQTQQYLFAQTGAELYGFARSPGLGAFDYRVFGGTIYLDPNALTPPGTAAQLAFNVPAVFGERLIWETPLDGLRFAGSAEAIQLDTTAYITGLMSPLHITSQSLLWVGSAEYAAGDWVLTAEYSRWRSRVHSDNPALSPANFSLAERAYVMATYRAASWFQPGVYYALFFPNVHDRSGRANQQHDVAATLRFDITPHWLVKLEGHYMNGTAGLVSPVDVDGPDVSNLPDQWAAFFAKTTGYF
ncbi:MAG TPA: hypothetical protein VHV30_01805 [Polyangiaceae bacterium]|jgi:hypothetical protein|nr:hypothetical protein [Polyangiaceae bacterium]